MSTFTLKEVLDLAGAEGEARYRDGFRDGLAAAEKHHAATLEQDAAEAVDAVVHARAVAVLAGLKGQADRSWSVLGIDPMTATSQELTEVAEFRRAYGIERFRRAVVA